MPHPNQSKSRRLLNDSPCILCRANKSQNLPTCSMSFMNGLFSASSMSNQILARCLTLHGVSGTPSRGEDQGIVHRDDRRSPLRLRSSCSIISLQVRRAQGEDMPFALPVRCQCAHMNSQSPRGEGPNSDCGCDYCYV